MGWRMLWSLAAHNQLLQYSYLSNMFRLGVFSADKEFSRILSMGIKEYAEEMEDIYLCSIPPI